MVCLSAVVESLEVVNTTAEGDFVEKDFADTVRIAAGVDPEDTGHIVDTVLESIDFDPSAVADILVAVASADCCSILHLLPGCDCS